MSVIKSNPPCPYAGFKPEGKGQAESLLPAAPGGTKPLQPRAVKGHSPHRATRRKKAGSAPGMPPGSWGLRLAGSSSPPAVSVCAHEALAGVECADYRELAQKPAETEDREAGELGPSPGIPAILGRPAGAPGMLRVWPGQRGHCEHRGSPRLQSPQRLQQRDLQRGPRPPAATQGSPSGLEGEWAKDIAF